MRSILLAVVFALFISASSKAAAPATLDPLEESSLGALMDGSTAEQCSNGACRNGACASGSFLERGPVRRLVASGPVRRVFSARPVRRGFGRLFCRGC